MTLAYQAVAPRIAGGFVTVSTTEVVRLWSFLQAGRIRLLDVRAYLACLELRIRRKRHERGRKPNYRISELTRLLGGGGGEKAVKASVRRLERAGLLSWSTEAIRLLDGADAHPVPELEAMGEIVHAERKKLQIPRRSLRMISGSTKKAVIATMLAQLIRCLYAQSDQGWSTRGNCKASWIAEAFSVAERSVIRARKHLVELGWMKPVDTPFWHRQSQGARYEINAEFDRRDASAGEQVCQVEGLDSAKVCQVQDQKRYLSSRGNNQNPRRERSDLWQSGWIEKPGRPPSFKRLVPEDLASTGRLVELCKQAFALGFEVPSEETFVALAKRARARGSLNPCGLFAHMVRNPKCWAHVTIDDEDTARWDLKEFRYGETKPEAGGGGEPFSMAGAEEDPPESLPLGQDAQKAAVVVQYGAEDKLEAMRRHERGWSAERWVEALVEILDHDETTERLAYLVSEELELRRQIRIAETELAPAGEEVA